METNYNLALIEFIIGLFVGVFVTYSIYKKNKIIKIDEKEDQSLLKEMQDFNKGFGNGVL